MTTVTILVKRCSFFPYTEDIIQEQNMFKTYHPFILYNNSGRNKNVMIEHVHILIDHLVTKLSTEKRFFMVYSVSDI